jgi:hypothetical protein
MSTLADVIRQRRSSGQTRTKSLMGSLKDKFLEKIDPRQFLNQTGVMSALFPSLKSFKARGISSSEITTKISPVSNEMQNETLKIISRNTKIAAINYSLLPSIARDANVMKQNIGIMVENMTLLGKQATKPDAFFLKQKEMEKLYETNVGRAVSKEKKIERVEKTEKKSFNWIRFFGLVGVGLSSALLVDFLLNRDDSIVYKTYKSVKEEIMKFSVDIKKFVDDIYHEIEIYTTNSVEVVKNTLNNLLEEMENISIKEAFSDLIDPEKSVFDQFERKIAEAKEQLASRLEQFSFLPSAQAATLPSSMRRDEARTPMAVTPTTVKSFTDTSPDRMEETGVKNLLNVIARAEGTSDEQASSKGFASGYDVPFGYGRFVMPEKPLTQMTISEVKEYQSKLVDATRGKIKGVDPRYGTSAVGKYQIIGPTLKGLQAKLGISDSEIFSAELQDKMAIELLKEAGMNRVDPVKFQNNIAGIWASIPKVDGRGVHGFAGVSQPLGTTSQVVSQAISQITPEKRIAQNRNVNEPLVALSAAVSDEGITTGSKNDIIFEVGNNNSVNIFKYTSQKVSLQNPYTRLITYVTQ